MSKSLRVILVSAAVALLLVTTCALFYNLFILERVTGKVLIVQGNAYANRMALVQVVAISSEDARAWRDSIILEHTAQMSLHREQRLQREAALRVSLQGYDRQISAHGATISSLRELAELANSIWLVDRLSETTRRRFFRVIQEIEAEVIKQVEASAMSSDWQKVVSSLKRELIPAAERRFTETESLRRQALARFAEDEVRSQQEAQRELEAIVSQDRLSRLPRGIDIVARDRTDDTGEFSLRLPRGDYYLFAQAQRNVLSGAEEYYWAQPVKVPSQFSEKCLLGNNNLVGVGDDDLWAGLRRHLARIHTDK